MSTISSLGGDSLKGLPDAILRIEQQLEGWEKNIQLDGKNIQSANVEQPSWIAYYDQLAVQADTIVEYVEMLVKKVRAERTRYIKENVSKEYTDTAIQKVVDGDKEYIKIYQIYLEVKELHDTCKSIVEAFKQRSYSLNNIVRIHEHELENITIRFDQ